MLLYKRSIYPLILPLMILVLAGILIWQWDKILPLVRNPRHLQALLVILPMLPSIILFVGFIMGWRYNNAALMLASLVLALSYLAFTMHTGNTPSEENMRLSVTRGISFLLPLNLASFTMMTKRRIFTTVGIVSLVLIFIQSIMVLVFCYPQDNASSQFLTKITSSFPQLTENLSSSSGWISSVLSYNVWFGFESMAIPSMIAFSLALIFGLGYFIYTRDIQIGGLFLALVATLMAFAASSPDPAFIFYFIAAGLILIVTAVEASFSMAYIDELTGLPGRRSLNETLLNLGKMYAIAMIDVDYFKKFNDSYGHKTGDQVLRMIASKLERMSGGAKTFRYGGEEFTAIFPGKDMDDTISHVEGFRQAVESTPFVVREGDRRGRRDKGNRGQGKSAGQEEVNVTVSIGVASPDKDLTDPEKVLKAADKSLYDAKNGGRNQVAYYTG
ncbi:MAG: GGDEF domain-containing protein [Desulfobacterales bacterium]